MKQEIKCPYCNASLEGENTMRRAIICEDDYFGIINGGIEYCEDDYMLAPPQKVYGSYVCNSCDEDIDDYIYDLIDEEVITD